jgi:cyclophilin family peptidyl-prolyl cis-trans isomerase/HEAT repeat protein
MAASVSTLALALLAALAPASRCFAAAAAAAPRAAASPMRAIAIAEDQRRFDAELRRYLSHRDPAVRARAVLAVGRLQDSTSAPSLLPLLADPVVAVRREAAFALGQIGRREARAGLEHALEDHDPEVVDLALEAIGKLGDHASTPAVTRFLDSGSALLRRDAAVALWRIADTTAAGALITHLGDPDVDARWRMAYALEKLPLPARVVPAVAPMLQDSNALVRAHAARTLGREKSALATSALLGALGDKDPAVIVQALRALVLVADTTDMMQLHTIGPLMDHVDPYVRVTAATAMAERFAWVRCTFPDSQAAGHHLMGGLEDVDPATRAASGRAIVLRFGHDGLNIAGRLEHDHSPYTRAGWMDGMRTLDDPDWAEHRLEGGLDRSQPLIVRMTAADIAGELGHRKPNGALRPLLDTLRAGVRDSDILYAASCAGALASWGDTASVPMLARTYATRGKDADADARIGIRDALRELAGRAFADSVEHAHPQPAPPVKYAADFQDEPKEKRVVMHFRSGDIEWELLGREAPQTVRNFVKLARRGYFNGLFIHRVVPDFVIQDGDPTGTGSGGPGWSIRCEYNHERYEAGMVGMALSGKDTGGSQYFITLSPQPHLDGRYTIFARVTRGLDLARRIQQGATVLKVDVLP